ncbi:MAG TPA: anaerobic ribonucleoside-triphosphate reductase activating protein [Candidatus Kaiserbacteria bacterium]|nr:anaerobic ribonucleoside-triphosphate reductase activating protein [Candidatus Kaiserbacteria bacterium]
MRIGGLQPFSLIDYPGSVSATIFTVGCTFRCPYCHNPELVLETPDKIISEDEIFSFLKKRAGALPALTITGGEPTVQNDLPEFMRRVKALGYKIKLDSNGTNPSMLKDILAEKLADFVAMDIKAPLSAYARTVGAAVNEADIAKSVAMLLSGEIPYEFRTTVVRSQLSPEDFLQIGKEIAGAKRYVLQQFNPAKTLHPSFRKKLSYSTEELEAIATTMHPYVEHCEIRA